MRVVIVGAGAVGAVVGSLLAQAGHEVYFWVRPERRAQLAALRVERAGRRVSMFGSRADSGASTAPRCLSAGDAVPASDWVIVCVRGEQLDEALRELVAHMGSQRRVAIATISLAGVIERARACGVAGEVYALHVSFASYALALDPPLYRWFPFLPPSLVTPDGERAHLAQARSLARALAQAGLAARARLSVTSPVRALAALITVLTLGWELCGWELEALAREPALRVETATAMREALCVVAPPRSPLRLVPRVAFALLLRVLPWFMSERARALWHSHGPKIHAQNAHVTDELLARAERRGVPTPALRGLFENWRAGRGRS